MCRLTSSHTDARDYYYRALRLNPLLWSAYEELCAVGKQLIYVRTQVPTHAALQGIPVLPLRASLSPRFYCRQKPCACGLGARFVSHQLAHRLTFRPSSARDCHNARLMQF